MRPADMAAIADAMKYALGESPHDLLARVERDLERRGYALPRVRREEPERCARCGGLRHDRDHELSSDAVCRCGGRMRRLRGYLDAVDPGRRMTLDSLDASEPTLAAALREARGIAMGERRKGMLLIGQPSFASSLRKRGDSTGNGGLPQTAGRGEEPTSAAERAPLSLAP